MSRSIASFVEGFAGAQQDRRARDERDKLIEAIKASRQPVAGAPGGFTGAGFGDEGEPVTGHKASRRGGTAYKTGDPVAEGLSSQQKALLNAIAGGESGGVYNVRYTPQGGANFEGFDQHPGIFEAGPHGPSSAAGRYQFTKSTWDGLGGGAFTPERQDVRAWQLASDRYRANTGRDLGADLQARGLDRSMTSALAPTWAALKGVGADRAIATYNDSMARYGAAAAPVARSVEPPAMEWGALRRLQTQTEA